MKTKLIERSSRLAVIALTAVTLSALSGYAANPDDQDANAQGAADTATGYGTGYGSSGDTGSNVGWLGLAGLIGLFGLMKKTNRNDTGYRTQERTT